MNIQLQEMQSIAEAEAVDWQALEGKTILVTGATGLIGTTLVNGLAYANRERNLHLRIICAVRNKEKAESRLDRDAILWVTSLEDELSIDESIDFIVHAANPTSSAYFVNNPVETIQFATRSTTNLLELAKKKSIKGFVYLSSMEVYGHPERGHIVTEKEVAGFDTTVARNCYPLSKQMCEMLCTAYYSEYKVPTKILRLTQTFGPGVEYNDGRVFAEFMRCAVERKDIVLHTAGKTERCYLYTTDAATAILTVMTKGNCGEAYTAANPATYCSIIDMAKMVAADIAGGEIEVKVEIDQVNRGYASELYMNLDTGKLKRLGWKPTVGLAEMYRRMIEGLHR